MKIYRINGKSNVCGANIRKLREEQGLSQEEFAAKLQLLGLDTIQKTVSRIETGVRVVPDYELEYYAKVLETDILDLLKKE